MIQKKIRFIFGFLTVLALLMPFNSTSFAQSPEQRPLHIVHLGDSYSAGNGAGNYYSPSGCYRSTTNWGMQFARSLPDMFHVVYQNHACSDAVVEHIMNERLIEKAVNTDENGNCPGPTPNGEVTYKPSSTSTNKCDSIIAPQINYINDTTDLVLITMGGNDMGFGKIVVNCYSPAATAPLCAYYIDDALDNMSTLTTDLTKMFANIKDEMNPDGKIVYVSYPYLNKDVEYTLPLDPNDPPFDFGATIRALEDAGDLAQKAAVDAANAAEIAKGGKAYVVFYDGTKTVFAGHEPDPSSEQNRDGWINEFTDENGRGFFDGGTMSTFYHPNPLGHTNWASALSPLEDFDTASGSFEDGADIDVVFVVDTTSSMGEEIAEVQTHISSLVSQLYGLTSTYRVAVVSYRDDPSRTSYSGDYPSKVIQEFTDDPALIQTAINSLTLGYGGDWPETVFSGIQAANDLEWRTGVTKIAIVIGDAPALSPEPISNLTASQIIANSIAIDPVQVIGVDVGYLNYNGAVGQIATGTGGSMVSGTSGLTAAISGILDRAAKQPLAWVGEAYVGKIGQPIQFDASGSYDPSGLPITRYEWDFDGDGAFDLETAEPAAAHVYDAAFDGFVVLRVTGAGGAALASAPITVNTEGSVSQGNEKPCELDANGYSIVFDEEEGVFLNCTATTTPSIFIGDTLNNALSGLEKAIDGLLPVAFKNKYNVIKKEIEGDNPASACGSLQGMSELAKAHEGKKITQEQAGAVLKAVDALNNILVCSK